MLVLTIIHIATGIVAFLAGVVALCVRKGHQWHRRAGSVFCWSMFATALAGAWMALLLAQAITALGGLIAAYLVLTGWQSVLLDSPRGRPVPMLATGGVMLVTIATLALGALATQAPDGRFQDFAAGDYFFLASIAALAAAGDITWIVSGGYTGKRRLARHLWRMCTALFFATGSAFTGPGAGVFPAALRESGALAAPELLVLLTMVYWLIRMWRERGRQPST